VPNHTIAPMRPPPPPPTHTHTQYLLLFHSNSGFVNAPQCYIIHALLLLLCPYRWQHEEQTILIKIIKDLQCLLILHNFSFLIFPLFEDSVLLDSHSTALYTVQCCCLKLLIQSVSILKSSVPNFVAVCRPFYLSSEQLITALWAVACLNHMCNSLLCL
jgi:hypothetical protein